jgi:hypothetical protein
MNCEWKKGVDNGGEPPPLAELRSADAFPNGQALAQQLYGQALAQHSCADESPEGLPLASQRLADNLKFQTVFSVPPP